VPVTAGMIAGIAAALGLGRFIGHFIENAQSVGAWTSGAAALALIATSAAAVWTATHRVTRIDPVEALRHE
jgi:ABC-type antimicrobial peptide transport system permease subunit